MYLSYVALNVTSVEVVLGYGVDFIFGLFLLSLGFFDFFAWLALYGLFLFWEGGSFAWVVSVAVDAVHICKLEGKMIEKSSFADP